MSGAVALTRAGGAAAGRRAAVPAALVSFALLGVNAVAYVFTVLAARTLAPSAYGELAALLGVLLVGAVPGTGLQTAAALHLGRRPAAPGRATAGVHGTALAAALAVGVVGLLAAGPVVALLHLRGWSPVLWLVALLLPQTVIGGYDGVLQGTGRYGRLALVTAAFGLAKAGGGTAGLLVGGTPTAALAGMALGACAGTLLAWQMCGRPGVTRDIAAPARSAGRASAALLGLVVLVNLDLLLARHHLPARQAGEYAVAAVFAKIAFWLPQGVAVVLLPRLADPRARVRAVPAAVALVAGLGVLLAGATALLGRHALPLVGGAGYGDVLGAAVWLFTVLGTLLAVAQLLLYSGIAAADRTAVALVWAAALGEACAVQVLAAAGGLSPLALVGTAVGAAGLLVGAGLLRLRRAAAAAPPRATTRSRRGGSTTTPGPVHAAQCPATAGPNTRR